LVLAIRCYDRFASLGSGFVQVKYASINCIETCSQRIIFEQILNQLNPTNTNIKCESLHNFLLLLAQILSPPAPCSLPPGASSPDTVTTRPNTTYLVFDNAERLRSLPSNFLAAVYGNFDFI